MWFRFLNAIGLDDGRNGASYNKLITGVLTATVVYAIVNQIEVGTHLLILALGVLFGGFGLKGISMFATMYKRTDSVNLTGDAAKIVEAVRKQRDHAKGIDPA